MYLPFKARNPAYNVICIIIPTISEREHPILSAR
jgi:hypothetical protein